MVLSPSSLGRSAPHRPLGDEPPVTPEHRSRPGPGRSGHGAVPVRAVCARVAWTVGRVSTTRKLSAEDWFVLRELRAVGATAAPLARLAEDLGCGLLERSSRDQ